MIDKTYIFRNFACEYLFLDKNKYDYSGYGEINIPKEEYAEYLFFYTLPYTPNNSDICNQIEEYIKYVDFLSERLKGKKFYIISLYTYFNFSIVMRNKEIENIVLEFNNNANNKMDARFIDISKFIRNYSNNEIMDEKYYYLYNCVIDPKYKEKFFEWFMNEKKKYEISRKKCLVVDFDNTLWNGIIGEDGIENIQIGGGYPGNAFYDFQKLLIEIKNVGVILCGATKNNKSDVEELFEIRKDMPLKKDDFVVIESSWESKDIMISNISKKINILFDDIVFIDDSEYEREVIKCRLPNVTVLDFPKEPYMMLNYFSSEFKNLFYIEKVTQENEDKTKQYLLRGQVEEYKSGFENEDDFIKSLNIQVEYQKLNDANIERIVELINKSNQFNLTTKRYSKQEISEMKNDSIIRALNVSDKFGNHGITAIAIINLKEDIAYIDTFLMSCRIIGRKIEYTFLDLILEELKEMNIKNVSAKYIRSLKNVLVENFYDNAEFELVSKNENEKIYEMKLI